MKISSIDVPSGWDIEKGNINNTFIPDLLVSLPLPKNCSKNYKGIHYIGGRFVPKWMEKEFDMTIPTYEGYSQIIKLS